MSDLLTNRIAQAVGERIVAGLLPPGALLDSDIAGVATLRPSRTAWREAIKVLAGKGLVESRPRTGTTVRDPVSWNWLDPDVLNWRLRSGFFDRTVAGKLIELRRMVEPSAAEMAASRGSPASHAAISAAYERMVQAEAVPSMQVEADIDFHRAVIDATNNDFILAIFPAISRALRASFEVSQRVPGAMLAALEPHRELRDAIVARDSRAARARAEVLIDIAEKDLNRAFGAGQEGRPQTADKV